MRDKEDGMTAQTRIPDLIVRIQDEFFDSEGPLTEREVQRRVRTDDTTCHAVLGALVDAGVLMRLDDLYMRISKPVRTGAGFSRRRTANRGLF
jgi:hypothetical protein